MYASTMQFSDTRDAIPVQSSITSSNTSFESIGPTPVNPSTAYWIAVVAFDGEVHRLAVDSIRVYPLSEMSPGGNGDGSGSGGESWFDQLVDGDLNTVILMVSALMIILGAALIIRPRERAAPQPWEMGTQEVELEEELTREALGISEEEEIASSSILSQTDSISEDQTEDVEETTIEEIPLDESWEPDASVGELLSTQTEEIGLEGLNDLADELEEEDDDIDVSFLDDALDDN